MSNKKSKGKKNVADTLVPVLAVSDAGKGSANSIHTKGGGRSQKGSDAAKIAAPEIKSGSNKGSKSKKR